MIISNNINILKSDFFIFYFLIGDLNCRFEIIWLKIVRFDLKFVLNINRFNFK